MLAGYFSFRPARRRISVTFLAIICTFLLANVRDVYREVRWLARQGSMVLAPCLPLRGLKLPHCSKVILCPSSRVAILSTPLSHGYHPLKERRHRDHVTFWS